MIKKYTNMDKNSRFGFENLVEIMKILRSENGCPWDKEQDHLSIRKNFIEETYEVIEAIDQQDNTLLCEELGDVLLQVVFHAKIAEDEGAFDIEEVCDGICKKLIIRHPHIFADVEAKDSRAVLKNWDDIKKREKSQKTQTEVLKSVPRQLPALMRADKLQAKAAKVGFDWPDVSGALEKVEEERNELIEAISNSDFAHVREELGDLLFAVVNTSRKLGIDPEEALTDASDKFLHRFSKVEEQVYETGKEMKQLSLAELDEFWDAAKRKK